MEAARPYLDPYCQYGSGTSGAISIQIHMDPDPKHRSEQGSDPKLPETSELDSQVLGTLDPYPKKFSNDQYWN